VTSVLILDMTPLRLRSSRAPPREARRSWRGITTSPQRAPGWNRTLLGLAWGRATRSPPPGPLRDATRSSHAAPARVPRRARHAGERLDGRFPSEVCWRLIRSPLPMN